MIELGVNIDHVATLRQQRGTIYPDPVQAASMAEDAGADLITLHLREDRRHIQDADVFALRKSIRTRMNLECAVTPEMLAIACRVRPDDVCLVPERREELTTEGGLDVITHATAVRAAIGQLHAENIRVSLFIAPEDAQIHMAHQLGATVIELHTGAYAETDDNSAGQTVQLQRLQTAITTALRLGLRVNAGHGLHFDNVAPIVALPGLSELNIGHALIARALFTGLEKAVRDMKACLIQATNA